MHAIELDDDRERIRKAVRELSARFDEDYWLRCDREHRWAREFFDAFAQGGWFGVAMPEEYGGAGLGITEAALVMQTAASCGGSFAATSTIHTNVFGPHAVVVHGTAEQKRRILPPLISGEQLACFAVTEPNTGLDTTRLKTRAERHGDTYLISGQKVWISNAQHAQKMMIIARTTPLAECARPVDGLTLFYADLDRDHVEIREIDKMGRAAVDSNELFIDRLPVSVRDRIGEEGRGFYCLLDSLNPERILVAAEAVGAGFWALQRAAGYAREREVFGRPIGQNQGIQHPLAENWMELAAAEAMTFHAAALYDAGRPSGPHASAAKYLAAEAANHAGERAVLTHGGMGFAKEYHVERFFREVMLTRNGPVTQELVKSYIAERVLGLPKSY